MLSRRHFLAAAAAASIPAPSWAEAGAPAFLAAAKRPDGSYALCGLTAAGEIAFRVSLPDRGHAAAAHPTRPVAVAIARRPGRFGLVLDCLTGAVTHRLEPPADRHFYGHGAYLDDGRILVTTENAFATGEGRLGLWDAHRGYRRIGDMPSGGIGSHEVIRLPGTETLAVANGGIRTHPGSDRDKLNLDTMRPNLSYVRDGAVVETVELDPALRRASIRHIAARPDGLLAMALQWEGDPARIVPLLATHRQGEMPRTHAADEAAQAVLQGYAGSVAISGDGGEIAITGPRGGVAHVYAAEGTVPPRIVHRPDICGTAPAGAGLAFTDGLGGVLHPGGAALHRVAWDNHLVAIGAA
ncbi:DUF1513 domain-containing protein [uncultured Jannaschia sp.]|uniref:DUF1513 domain-containing protein n=1 Tax=uncultured Jannaschia sp. TaxID=293347 RepID=UPI00260F5E47|nr:DUF1513 domain-containing protein [uncultured Jannaschia sp.]